MLLKQIVTMEMIQWSSLWNKYKAEFVKEKIMIGGSLGDKAGEDLKLRIIEHVKDSLSSNLYLSLSLLQLAPRLVLTLINFVTSCAEYSRCLDVLL